MPKTYRFLNHIREVRSKRSLSLSPQICAFRTQVWKDLFWLHILFSHPNLIWLFFFDYLKVSKQLFWLLWFNENLVYWNLILMSIWMDFLSYARFRYSPFLFSMFAKPKLNKPKVSRNAIKTGFPRATTTSLIVNSCLSNSRLPKKKKLKAPIRPNIKAKMPIKFHWIDFFNFYAPVR